MTTVLQLSQILQARWELRGTPPAVEPGFWRDVAGDVLRLADQQQANGELKVWDVGDPAGSATVDQARAAARDRIRTARVFMLTTWSGEQGDPAVHDRGCEGEVTAGHLLEIIVATILDYLNVAKRACDVDQLDTARSVVDAIQRRRDEDELNRIFEDD